MARRRAKPGGSHNSKLSQMLRGEVVGSLLVVVAILTFLSLLSQNRGRVTGVLVAGLQVAFGYGAWFVPILVGGYGLWLAVRHLIDEGGKSAQRLISAFALFLGFEGAVHLFSNLADPREAALAGQGGGMTGWLISQALVIALGRPVTIGAMVLVVLASIVGLGGWSLMEIGEGARRGWRRALARLERPSDSPPQLPLRDSPPLWQRWAGNVRSLLQKARRNQLPAAEHALRAAPLRERTGNLPTVARGERPTRSSRPAPAKATAPVPAPKVAAPQAGSQVWQIPEMASILEDVSEQDIQTEDLRARAQIIEDTLLGFGIPVQVVEANQGPAVTQFGVRPGTIIRRNAKGEEKRIKVRVAQIQGLANDLSLALAASPLRIEAPVPGRDVVGVEVPNVQISLVSLRGVMDSEEYQTKRGTLLFGLGRDVSGQAAVADLARMPHLLIAGATGSGKSVCVNSIITSLLLAHTPETLRFLMIDPKRVELTVYNGIPHLIAPVVVDVERAVPVLQWATKEMERRYKLFAKASARNIEAFNEKQRERGEPSLPYVVILIDELADLMLSAPDDVERQICRIAQMARATGIHLVLATQRPSVDVVTGLIKANFPARIAFAVTSQIDSRVILDVPGAEQLLGKGDMLFMAPDASKLHRLQGCFVSDRETKRLVDWWRGMQRPAPQAMSELVDAQGEPVSGTDRGDRDAEDLMPQALTDGLQEPPWLPGQEMLKQPLWSELTAIEEAAGEHDDVYEQAVEEVRKAGRASVSLLQRRLRIGYSRAARLIDQMEADGIVGPDLGGSRGRDVLPDGMDAQIQPQQD